MADELKYMTVEELAKELHVSVRTIYDWEARGVGPRSRRAGRRILYPRVDVDAWLAASAS